MRRAGVLSLAAFLAFSGMISPIFAKDVVQTINHRRILVKTIDNPSARIEVSSYEDAVQQCEWIGLCQYIGCTAKPDAGFHDGVTAKYRVLKRLKGPILSHIIYIHYLFRARGHFEEAPKDWVFDESKMPEKNSQWILLIPNAVPIRGVGYETLQADFGRIPKSCLDRFQKLIKETSK